MFTQDRVSGSAVAASASGVRFDGFTFVARPKLPGHVAASRGKAAGSSPQQYAAGAGCSYDVDTDVDVDGGSGDGHGDSGDGDVDVDVGGGDRGDQTCCDVDAF